MEPAEPVSPGRGRRAPRSDAVHQAKLDALAATITVFVFAPDVLAVHEVAGGTWHCETADPDGAQNPRRLSLVSR